jgi:hypothetical protein
MNLQKMSTGSLVKCSDPGCNISFSSPAQLAKHCAAAHDGVRSESPLTPVTPTLIPLKQSLEREKETNMQKLVFKS